MSVEWTTNADGVYEVSSAAHLLQIMNNGALGADTNPPANYMSASFVQTADIDLANVHASIAPIGNDTAQFTGEYDGGLFQIKNWSWTGSGDYAGLFGYCDGATLKHIRLAGVWTTSERIFCGFLSAKISNSSTIMDVEGDFSEETIVGDGSGNYCGTLVGYALTSSLYGLTVRGTVELSTSVTGYRGGVVGYCSSSTLKLCRNLASFPNGISGNRVGGIVGMISTSLDASQLLNAMKGDIIGESYAGGVVGGTYFLSSLTFVVNSMTGNISRGTYIGGIVAHVYLRTTTWFSASRLLNYMRGDISPTNYSGGVVGFVSSNSATDSIEASITKSVVAMSGSVGGDAVLDYVSRISSLDVEVTVDTSFGMTFDNNTYGSATMVVDDALVYHSSFTDLPYFKFELTDISGKTYDDWDFVYANIGGKNPEYTHLSVHTSNVSAPYFTDFGLGDGNNVVYLTYANTDTNTLFHDSSLTIVQTAAATIVLTGAVSDGAGGDHTTAGLDGPTTKDDFLFGDVYDITEAGTQVSAVANDLFTTGDAVAVNINHQPTTTTFVNRGGAVDVGGVSALLLPFDPTVADVQDATFTLSDATSIDVGFDQTSGDILVDGTAYKHGDYFVLDGKKVTVFDV